MRQSDKAVWEVTSGTQPSHQHQERYYMDGMIIQRGLTRKNTKYWKKVHGYARQCQINQWQQIFEDRMGETMEAIKGIHLVINVWPALCKLQIWGSITSHLPLSCSKNKSLITQRNRDWLLVTWTLGNARNYVWLLFGHEALLYPADGCRLQLRKPNDLLRKNVG